MDKKIEEKTKDINEKIQKLDLAIQELIETTDNFLLMISTMELNVLLF
ncbi:hypothetical protein LXM98_18890 (plasmid) [Acinetobacter baumannii]|nr:hypothetical protein [Acinetobacter baumannii]UIM20521.1 hypothetical protein LXM98_18890 [Acinetobacter baumannii]VCW45089.1 hypothetical protein BANRA_02249 [Acinetobacter baumannii]